MPRVEPPLPCPFCKRRPTNSVRVNNTADGKYVAFVACYCGGVSATAHQMGFGNTPAEAEAAALRRWNTRGGRYIPPTHPAPATTTT